MKTLAYSFELRANAPEGQKRFPASSTMLVSKNNFIGLKLGAFAGVLCFCLANQSANAYSINWGSDTWDHSAFGGSANQVGWDKDEQGVTGGSAVYGPMTASVRVRSFGTADSRHTFFSPPPSVGPTEDYLVISPRPFDSDPEFNGPDPANKPALAFNSVNDYNNPAGSFLNYSLLSFSFSAPVIVTSFILGDIDLSNSGLWRDQVSVRGFSGINSVGVTYTPNLAGLANPYNQRIDTAFFAGINDSVGGIRGDANNNTADGEVGISFAGPVDAIEIYYWSGASAGTQHGIYLRENSFQFDLVPEPNVPVLLGVGGLMAGLLRFRRFSAK